MTHERFLWVGLVAGIGLILYGLITPPEPRPTEPNPAVAAVVGGRVIPVERFHAALAALVVQGGGNVQATAALRKRVMDDLVAEELLLQRALELDLPRISALARRRLLTDVIDALAAQSQTEPTEEEMKAWYLAHPEKLAGRKRYQIQAALFEGPEAESRRRAEAALAAISAGEHFAVVMDRNADQPVAPTPDGLLPASTLRNYLGPTATRVATELQPGQVSVPIRVAGGHRVVRLVARDVDERPPLAEVHASVRALMIRQQRKERVDAAIDQLRATVPISVNGALINTDAPVAARYLEAARVPSAEGSP